MNNKFLIGKLKEVKGSALLPKTSDNSVVVMFCTDDGQFDSVPGNEVYEKKWPKSKEIYRAWWREHYTFKGGEIKVNMFSSDIEFAHLLTCKVQKVEGSEEETINLSFEKKFVDGAFNKLSRYCSLNKRHVHINKVGSEEDWKYILEVIEKTLLTQGVHVYVYSE